MRIFALAALLSIVTYALVSRPTPEAIEAANAEASSASPQRVGVLREAFAGGTVVTPRVVTYPVAGSTEAEILASMRAGGNVIGGEAFFGQTVSEVSFQILPVQVGDGCVAEDVRVDLDVTIHLPEWSGSSDASYALRRDWSRFVAALRRHEETHRQMAERSAERTYQELRGLRRPTCDAVEAEARRRAEQIAAASAREQVAFDERTHHGETQGARWPLR